MTGQTRYFIEVADLIAWRFECRNCQASLELSLELLEKGVLNECPSCHRPWALLPGNGYSSTPMEPAFAKFIAALNDLKRLLGEKSVLGFTLTVEIKPPLDNE